MKELKIGEIILLNGRIYVIENSAYSIQRLHPNFEIGSLVGRNLK